MITKKRFQVWLAKNRPDLGAHEEKDLGKKGFYRLDLGPAFSFRSFDSWKAALEELSAD